MLNQVIDDLPQFHHAGDAPLGGVGQFHLRHHGIFPVEHLAVHYGVGEVFHIRVSRENMLLIFDIRNIWRFHLYFGVLTLNMLYRLGKLVGKAGALKGCNGEFLPSVLGAFCGQFAQHHLRVLNKVAVDSKAILGLAKLHPCRFNIRRAVTLLQKDNIADNIRACISLEHIVGQSNSPQQIGAFCHVFAGSAVLAVHGVAAGNKGNNAARTHLVDGFRKEIVVDGESQLVVRFVVDLVLTERHVAHCQIVEITAVGGLKAGNSNVSLRIQHLGNAPGDAVQFHAVQPTACHAVRQHSEEVAHTHGRLQDVAAAETHALHGIVDTTDNGGAGVVGIQHGAAGGSVLILGEQPFQLRILFCPTIFAGVKGI